MSSNPNASPAPFLGQVGSSSNHPADAAWATFRTRSGHSSPSQAGLCKDQRASQRTPAPNPGSCTWPEGQGNRGRMEKEMEVDAMVSKAW